MKIEALKTRHHWRAGYHMLGGSLPWTVTALSYASRSQHARVTHQAALSSIFHSSIVYTQGVLRAILRSTASKKIMETADIVGIEGSLCEAHETLSTHRHEHTY